MPIESLYIYIEKHMLYKYNKTK